jgi:hypothetical protein
MRFTPGNVRARMEDGGVEGGGEGGEESMEKESPTKTTLTRLASSMLQECSNDYPSMHRTYCKE